MKLPSKSVVCDVCPHKCVLEEGEVGLCGVRKNVGGKIVNLTYGKVSIVAVESIMKRPIFHYHPESMLLSLGSIGCNLKCKYCQNYMISQLKADEYRHFLELPPEKVAELSAKYDGVAFTYNEPLINYEYVRDSAKMVKDAGKIVAVSTNGFVEKWVLDEVLPYADAWNVDVKAFTDDFYKRYTGAWLKPVLDNIDYLLSKGKHVEITYLMVPDLNDGVSELERFAEWVASRNVKAVHIPRFYPHYKMMNKEPTKMEKIEQFADILHDAGVKNVHGGWEEYYGLWEVKR